MGAGAAERSRTAALESIFILTLLTAGVMAVERETGAGKILSACGGGRMKIFWRKQGIGLILSCFCALCFFLPDYINIGSKYGLEGWSAPVQALWQAGLEQFPLEMTIGAFLIVLFLLKCLVLYGSFQAVFLISGYMKKVWTAQVLSCLILLLPGLFWLMGLSWLRYFSPVWPAGTLEIIFPGGALEEKGFWILAAWLAAGGILLWINGKRALRGEAGR